MRYIAKPNNSVARSLLTKAKEEMSKAGISLIYDHFNDKEELNNELRKEQKCICCYCQQRIEHFQGNNNTGSHNEHFFPEHHPLYKDKQLEYENIFACCNRTKGLAKRFQHCGEYKADVVIGTNLLLDADCSQHFKYNSNGEILPNCSMSSYEEVLANRAILTDIQNKALAMIEGLNLNEDNLKKRRKSIIDDIFASAETLTIDRMQHKIQVFHNEPNEYVEFVDMIIYYLHYLINVKQHKPIRL